MHINWILVLGLTSMCNVARAQGCPSGIPSAGNPSCIPPDQQHSPYYQDNQTTTFQTPQPRWATRWGAIVIDDITSTVGAAVGLHSRRQAQKAALTECQKKGGQQCKVELAYHNQCAAIVWGTEFAATSSAATIEEAAMRAGQNCERKTTDCQVYYSDCSLPERIQ